MMINGNESRFPRSSFRCGPIGSQESEIPPKLCDTQRVGFCYIFKSDTCAFTPVCESVKRSLHHRG